MQQASHVSLDLLLPVWDLRKSNMQNFFKYFLFWTYGGKRGSWQNTGAGKEEQQPLWQWTHTYITRFSYSEFISQTLCWNFLQPIVLGVNLRKSLPPLLLSSGCTHLHLSAARLFKSFQHAEKLKGSKAHQSSGPVLCRKAFFFFFLTRPDDSPNHNHSVGPAKSGTYITRVPQKHTLSPLSCLKKKHPAISSVPHPNSSEVPKSCCYFYSTHFH